ncbi:voltage-dependent potassium channel beta subunit [Luteimonas sp. J16]|jgi:voltage-dependent potassium channel beta subunit|uniref:aldo/keto reductase n=1 Tax=unclassified Luteimonas TaxID=2629088 RepID=UPI000478AB9F|nr:MULTISPECIES: aldo/keto reductase [unclassified Luteimonas]TWG94396.1 voltage-dependent potassium channel beta subunit [Luteimonas sp. J16]
MQYRRLGGSGLKLSALSLGTWLTAGARLGRGEMRELVALAWDHGVNFFDSAENYAHGEAERVLGDVVADLRLPRDGFCVSSKVCFGSAAQPRPTQAGLSRKHVRDACHDALRRLRVDYLDLFFCHRPDPDTPVAETVRAMDDLVRQGKVLYWGTSEWPATLIREAFDVARAHHLAPPTMEQPQYNLLHRERVELEYASLYAECGLGTTVWSPLAFGLLSGKYDAGIPEGSRMARPDAPGRLDSPDGQARLARARRFSAVAAELGVAPAPLAIAWCLGNPHVSSVILGASRPDQLVENLGALELAGRFDEPVWRRLEAVVG